MTLNGSIGIRLGLSGGFIMDRTGNVYFVRGGGIVSGLDGTVAIGKFSINTSGWYDLEFRRNIEGRKRFLWYQWSIGISECICRR